MHYFKNSSTTRVFSWLIVALTVCSVSGCAKKIKLPSQDSTPPTYKWVVIVLNNNNDKYEYTTPGATLNIGKQYKYTVTFNVYDSDGGVKHLALNGGGMSACPISYSGTIYGVSTSESANFQPDSNGEVETQTFLMASMDTTCKHSSSPLEPQVVTGPGGAIQYSGEGENYYGGKVTSNLTVVSVP